MTAPLVAGVDISGTASGIARSTGEVHRHGRPGFTKREGVPTADRGTLLRDLVVELRDLTIVRHAAQMIIGEEVSMGGGETMLLPALVLVEDFAGPAHMDPERGYLWWAFVNAMTWHNVPVVAVAPSKLKLYACGRGDANKREVIAGLCEWLPDWEQRIRKTGTKGNMLDTYDDNKADAVALMAMGLDLLGYPLAEVSERQRSALNSLMIPDHLRG